MEGEIILSNPALRDMFNLENNDSEEVTNLKQFLADEDHFELMLEKLEENNSIRDFDTKLNIDGKELIVNLNVSVSSEGGNNNKFLNGSMHDVTEKKMAEEKIRLYNQELENLNQSKDKFFSIIAHDLITPIAALLGYSEILANENEKLDAKIINEFARSINTVSKSAHNLLLELLDWSRLHTGRMPCTPTSIDISYITKEVKNLLNENLVIKEIELKNEIPEGENVYADFKMLNSIMRNLVGNAIKFTNKGGVIRIYSSRKDNGFIEVSVEDNGAGIKEKDLAKLFKIDEHFSTKGTANEKGSGLGLILCKEFVKKNGGEIWAESEIGKGTRISFTLPLSEDQHG
jgi:PAS domain S-box-containing protein